MCRGPELRAFLLGEIHMIFESGSIAFPVLCSLIAAARYFAFDTLQAAPT